jgi:hypothetical protein
MGGTPTGNSKKERPNGRWRKQARNCGRLLLEGALRGASSTLATSAIGAVIIWWQSRH